MTVLFTLCSLFNSPAWAFESTSDHGGRDRRAFYPDQLPPVVEEVETVPASPWGLAVGGGLLVAVLAGGLAFRFSGIERGAGSIRWQRGILRR